MDKEQYKRLKQRYRINNYINKTTTDIKKILNNNGIDVLAAPKDPRDVSKIESKYITKILDIAKTEYDVILVDTHHLLDETTLVVLDACYMKLGKNIDRLNSNY